MEEELGDIGYTKEWDFKFDERKKKEEVPELAKYVERRKWNETTLRLTLKEIIQMGFFFMQPLWNDERLQVMYMDNL